MSEWISVKDRVPDSSIDVIIFSPPVTRGIGYYDKILKKWYFWIGEMKICDEIVTHWMPLPWYPDREQKIEDRLFDKQGRIYFNTGIIPEEINYPYIIYCNIIYNNKFPLVREEKKIYVDRNLVIPEDNRILEHRIENNKRWENKSQIIRTNNITPLSDNSIETEGNRNL